MRKVTEWFDHDIYCWNSGDELRCMEEQLKEYCKPQVIDAILSMFPDVTLESVEFYPAGRYMEPCKMVLTNIPDFYEIRMRQKVTARHTGTLRVYLPVRWNHRFMGIAGAGTNNEVDWYTSPTYNVLTWPIAIRNGYACAVADNDTGIRLDCTWGFDENRKLEWDHIDAWAFNGVLHQMTVLGKAITSLLYGDDSFKSYIHGTSGGGRQAVSEAIRYPDDYDGIWADGPAMNHLPIAFSSLWAPIVEANEKHIVPLEKYMAAYDLAREESCCRKFNFSRHSLSRMRFLEKLLDYPTSEGPITARDLQVMVKTWDGPVTRDGRRINYGFGPTIRQWPVDTPHPYGYLTRKEDGRLSLMPIAEQMFRWFTGDPELDIHSCSYEQFDRIYDTAMTEFAAYALDSYDFTRFASAGGKLIITQGTGDPIIPHEMMIDYYAKAITGFPSEDAFNDTVRMFMPEGGGHSMSDWTGGMPVVSDGMRALTDWVEKGIAPAVLPSVYCNYIEDRIISRDNVPMFNYWGYKKKQKLSMI